MNNSSSKNTVTLWTSRWSFLLAAFGASIGLGNIWKFPYEIGLHGGGPFLLVYLICLLVIAFPIMLAEVMIGRYGKQSPIHAIATIATRENSSALWQVIGWLAMLTGLIIFSFYSVVASWILFYAMKSVTGSFVGVPAEIVQNEFGALLLNTDQLLIWHTVFVLLVVLVLSRELNKGVELADRLLMPCLVAIMVWLLIYARSVGDFDQAYQFMFDFDFSRITAKIIISALSQAFFTLGISTGVLIMYGAYVREERSLFALSGILLFFDTVVAILMALIIFSVVFAFEMQPDSGVGLIFETLPVAFSQMPNSILWSTLFFLLLLFAALLSAFSLLEPSVAWLCEQFNLKRKIAAWVVGCLVWILGLLSVYAFTDLKFDFYYLGDRQANGFFDLFNILSTHILLPLIGLLTTIFAGWVITRKQSQRELAIRFDPAFKVWRIFIKFVAPLCIAAGLLSVLVMQGQL